MRHPTYSKTVYAGHNPATNGMDYMRSGRYRGDGVKHCWNLVDHGKLALRPGQDRIASLDDSVLWGSAVGRDSFAGAGVGVYGTGARARAGLAPVVESSPWTPAEITSAAIWMDAQDMDTIELDGGGNIRRWENKGYVDTTMYSGVNEAERPKLSVDSELPDNAGSNLGYLVDFADHPALLRNIEPMNFNHDSAFFVAVFRFAGMSCPAEGINADVYCDAIMEYPFTIMVQHNVDRFSDCDLTGRYWAMNGWYNDVAVDDSSAVEAEARLPYLACGHLNSSIDGASYLRINDLSSSGVVADVEINSDFLVIGSSGRFVTSPPSKDQYSREKQHLLLAELIVLDDMITTEDAGLLDTYLQSKYAFLGTNGYTVSHVGETE